MTMEIKMETVVKRFRDYISFNTQSDEANDKECPSTPGQMVLAKHLADELRSIGLTEVTVDEHGYVMATLPANNGDDSPVVGFISHLDTSPDAAGGPIHEQIIHAYAGGDIVLNEAKGIVFSVADFPGIERYKGQDIMMTDGTTLLGADDKAGVTAIVSAAEYLMAHPEISHGKIRLGFTPDEEIGRGADRFDVAGFGADYAYTVDGGAIGELEYENFNAASAKIVIRGKSIHPGSAKGQMVNAALVAMELHGLLPALETPYYTDGYEGFYHLTDLQGETERAELHYIIRDHDRAKFEDRKAVMQKVCAEIDRRYGAGTVELTLRDSYYNMKEKIEPHMYLIDLAKEAMTDMGITPVVSPVRGGTDGARLSYMGLPCPNLCTGGHNYHGRFEYVCVQSMEKVVELLLKIMEKFEGYCTQVGIF